MRVPPTGLGMFGTFSSFASPSPSIRMRTYRPQIPHRVVRAVAVPVVDIVVSRVRAESAAQDTAMAVAVQHGGHDNRTPVPAA